MKKSLILAAIAFLTTGIASAQTQTTNRVQQLNIRLLGFKQGGVTTNGNVIRTNVALVRVNNQAIIAALGAATGNTFSNRSRLVLITPVAGGGSSVAVRTGSNSVDVTGFFVLEQIGDSVVSSQRNTRTGRSSSTEYSLERLVLQNSGSNTLTLHFDVRGLITESSAASATSVSTLPSGWNWERRDGFGHDRDCDRGFGGWQITIQSIQASGNVSGSGDQNGTPVLLQGTISIQGNTLEVVTDGSNGNPT